MIEESKKDAFLNAIIGTTPIKKSNKNYKPISKSKINQERKSKKKLETKPQIPKEKNIYQEEETHTRFKIEKSKFNKKLKKGLVSIDRKVDFHGLTIKEAKTKFFETIDSCFFTNKRCILFITGKGINASQNIYDNQRLYYGKIRNEFLNWTHKNIISKKILSVERAGPAHGGDGAFFVYLRKNKN